jgi:hypothetical protein
MPFFSLPGFSFHALELIAHDAKSEDVSALRQASSDASVRQSALLDGDY